MWRMEGGINGREGLPVNGGWVSLGIELVGLRLRLGWAWFGLGDMAEERAGR